MNLLILYIGIAIGVSFLCSILEAVLLSLTPSYVEQIARQRPEAGAVIRKVRVKMDESLAAILILNTFAHTMGAAGVGAQALKVFGPEKEMLIAVMLTLAILYFSEIIPKTIGALFWKRILIPATIAVQILIVMTYPLVILLELISRWLAKGENCDKVSREEVIAMAELGEDEGTIEESESTVIENVLMLDDIPVEAVSYTHLTLPTNREV